MGLFNQLLIETATLCNRKCPTCLRQTDPTRSRWNEDGTQIDVKLPTETVHSVIDQAAEMGYQGYVYLYGLGEPLLEPRYFDFARYAREKGLKVGLFTSADMLTPRNPDTEKIVKQIEELTDKFVIDEYYIFMDHLPAKKYIVRRNYLKSLFKNIKITWAGKHINLHWSPNKIAKTLIKRFRKNPCYLTGRMYINHMGEMQLCCVDILCRWNLGNIYDSTLHELWYSSRHQMIVKTLAQPNGRLNCPHCRICPLIGGTKEDQGRFLK